jgi:NTP pyrophosphatase (non-canonical NTP hydrolase)
VSAGPYAIGSSHWPGLSKLTEEAGEVLQVVGKLVATNGETAHWDGSDLKTRLESELGDLLGAIRFVIQENGLDERAVMRRRDEKMALFSRWHEEQKAEVPHG